jgi:flagellar basal-body rod protein FlgC
MNTIQTALSGLKASLKQVEGNAANIANITTTGRLNGNAPAPYRAVETVQTATGDTTGGVRAENIPKQTPFVPAFDPSSPFADSEGLIGVPNVNLAEEAVSLSMAELTYKANLKVLQTISDMEKEALRIFDDKV